jgi:hypothetical protein
MPISIKIKKGKNTRVNISSSIKDPKRFIDWICELSNITMMPCDTLTISWDVTVYLSCDDAILDVKPIKVEQTFRPEKEMVVNFARFVHFKNKSRIYIYQEMPKVSFPDENK